MRSFLCLFSLLICVILVSFTAVAVQPSYNGLALKPPMGWNTWNRFACNIDEQLIRSTADLYVSTGLKDAGYEYLIMDDCWMNPFREPNGTLLADKTRFPSGIKNLIDYVHSKGLKFGLYSSPTQLTCQGRPASYGYERIDAKNWAEWGVDYLKHDWCSFDRASSPLMWEELKGFDIEHQAAILFGRMSDALRETGRNITYSLSNGWWMYNLSNWAYVLANLYRISSDISNGWGSIMKNSHVAVSMLAINGPGHWNDPDMLEIGNTEPGTKGKLTFDEQKSHFAIWAILPAPLIVGNDLREATPATMSILTNKHLIRVNQDSLGKPAEMLIETEKTWALRKELDDGSYAVVIVNLENHAPQSLSFTAKDLGLKFQKMNVLDAWTGEKNIVEKISVNLQPHHNAAFIISSA